MLLAKCTIFQFKLDIFYASIRDSGLEIISTTAIWLQDDVSCAEIFQLSDYQVHRKDRNFNQVSNIRIFKNCIRSESLSIAYIILIVNLELSHDQFYVFTLYIPDIIDLNKFDQFG